jgi:hypothetical protein
MGNDLCMCERVRIVHPRLFYLQGV